MLLWGMAIDAYIIISSCITIMLGEMVCCLVHMHLKDILGHPQAKWHIQEPVSATMVLKWLDTKIFSSRWMLQKPSLVSSLLKHVAPLNQ